MWTAESDGDDRKQAGKGKGPKTYRRREPPSLLHTHAHSWAFPPKAVLGPFIQDWPKQEPRERGWTQNTTNGSIIPPGVNAGPNTAFGGKGRKRPSNVHPSTCVTTRAPPQIRMQFCNLQFPFCNLQSAIPAPPPSAASYNASPRATLLAPLNHKVGQAEQRVPGRRGRQRRQFGGGLLREPAGFFLRVGDGVGMIEPGTERNVMMLVGIG